MSDTTDTGTEETEEVVPPTADSVVKPTWMSDAMYDEWLTYYLDAGGDAVPGSSNTATQRFRASPNYETYFPGIKREDGSIRYTVDPEQTYYRNIEGFRNAIEDTGITDTDLFSEGYIELIKGDVSVDEFRRRTSAIYNRVLIAGDSIRAYYADNFGLELSNPAIVASLLDERVSTDILNRNIAIAEVGGTASLYDFNLARDFVDELVDVGGMERQEAVSLFGSAQQLLPALGALAARHGDPDDEFDIRDFAEASGYIADPDAEAARVRRLRAQEESTFTGGAQIDYMRDRTGGVAGLRDV